MSFCNECNEVLGENEKCRRCEGNNNFPLSSLDLSPVCFGFLSTDEGFGRNIMAMGQLFDDDRRTYKGYRIYFYPDEFEPVGDKKIIFLHIHFFNDEGEIRLYLSDSKYLDIEVKRGEVPRHCRTKIKKFVEKHKQDIINKIENKLKEIREKIK